MQKSSLPTDTEAVRRLRADTRGRVIAPADADYESARGVYYSGFDRRPAAIAQPENAADVARIISFAREAGIALAVRSGGHSPAGHGVADDAIVLDLSAMRGLEIDPSWRTAWAETGLTAGEYTEATGAHGLATGFGDTPSVGIGGITLGGGLGFLHRKYGLTIDSLLAAEIVTAAGERMHADANSHADLFWAIRGGGGNFGVATRFLYRLHEVSDVMGGIMFFPATPEFIRAFIAALMEAPDELSGMVNIMYAPPMPLIPAEYHGRLVLMAFLVHSGPVPEGEREVARLRSLATPIVDMVRPMAYTEVYEGVEPPKPARAAMRSFFMDEVDRAAAEAIVDALERSRAPMRVVQLRVLGGAVARVPNEATAFAHRDRNIMAAAAAMYEDPADAAEREAWAARTSAELRQGEPGAYVGFMGEGGEACVREAYPAGTWERLASIKARYDPTNVFRLNQNIPPAEAVTDPGESADVR